MVKCKAFLFLKLLLTDREKILLSYFRVLLEHTLLGVIGTNHLFPKYMDVILIAILLNERNLIFVWRASVCSIE